MKIGYEPEEVEFAIHHYDTYEGKYKTPLDFLHLEWHERKKMVQTHIGEYVQERGMKDVGVPSLIEARDCLVECRGVMNDAIALCARKREEKVSVSGKGKCCAMFCKFDEVVNIYPNATCRLGRARLW